VWSFVVQFLSCRVLCCCGVVLVVSYGVLSLLCVCVSLTIGWAGVCCERRWSAHDVNGTFKEGTNTGGEGRMPRRTHRGGGGAHRDLTSDRGHRQRQGGLLH